MQNAFDEQGVKIVKVTVDQAKGTGRITVEDDAPEGFQRLSDAWTLYASCHKRPDPTKSGRYNLAEKVIVALSRRVTIETTKGTVEFTSVRRQGRARRPFGSKVEAELRMNAAEYEEIMQWVNLVIVPDHIMLTVNGTEIPHKRFINTFEAALMKEERRRSGWE